MTGELVGDPAVGYRDFASNEAVTLFVTTDGRMIQVDPDTLTPIGLPFGNVGRDEWLVLDDDGRRVAILGGNPLGPIVSGHAQQTLRLYDVASRTQLGATIDLGEIEAYEAGAAFNSDGMELAVDTEQGIVVWDLDPDHWVDAACDVAGRNLTHTEWDQYIGDLAPYRATCPQYAID